MGVAGWQSSSNGRRLRVERTSAAQARARPVMLLIRSPALSRVKRPAFGNDIQASNIVKMLNRCASQVSVVRSRAVPELPYFGLTSARHCPEPYSQSLEARQIMTSLVGVSALSDLCNSVIDCPQVWRQRSVGATAKCSVQPSLVASTPLL